MIRQPTLADEAMEVRLQRNSHTGMTANQDLRSHPTRRSAQRPQRSQALDVKSHVCAPVFKQLQSWSALLRGPGAQPLVRCVHVLPNRNHQSPITSSRRASARASKTQYYVKRLPLNLQGCGSLYGAQL